MKENPFALMLKQQHKTELQKVLTCNSLTADYGLRLTAEDAELLLQVRRDTLKEQQRVEFSGGILPKLIEAFCDSDYIRQDSYVETLSELQEIFYVYKNESLDLLTDEELLAFMREQFDGVCYGSIQYLSETCLERFAQAVRSGYAGYQQTGGRGEYEKLSQEQRWDRDLFLEVLNNLVQ